MHVPCPKARCISAPSQGLLNLSLTLTSHLYHPIFQTGERPASRRLWPEPDSFPTWVSSMALPLSLARWRSTPLILNDRKRCARVTRLRRYLLATGICGERFPLPCKRDGL